MVFVPMDDVWIADTAGHDRVAVNECLQGLRPLPQQCAGLFRLDEIDVPSLKRLFYGVVADDCPRRAIFDLAAARAGTLWAEAIVLDRYAVGLRVDLMLEITSWVAIVVKVVAAEDGGRLQCAPPRRR